jgi:hypothetical protein
MDEMAGVPEGLALVAAGLIAVAAATIMFYYLQQT